jgi:hypothetical protein
MKAECDLAARVAVISTLNSLSLKAPALGLFALLTGCLSSVTDGSPLHPSSHLTDYVRPLDRGGGEKKAVMEPTRKKMDRRPTIEYLGHGPYVCSASGFGQMSRCFRRPASL